MTKHRVKPVDAEHPHDMVNHPLHYKQGKFEVIDVIEDNYHLGYHRLNALKYIMRSPFKGTQVQDLRKAVWYLERYIDRLEKAEVEKGK